MPRSPRKRNLNSGSFQRGRTPAGTSSPPRKENAAGFNCARKYTVCGRWHLDWLDRCSTLKKGEY